MTMVSEQWFIDIIKENTPYKRVNFAEENNIDLLHDQNTTPRIFVGHRGIKLQYPETFFTDAYKGTDNQELLITEIQFICTRAELPTVRDNIKNAYTGKSPFPGDSSFSTINFMEASLVAKTTTKIYWSESVGLVMPRIGGYPY